jgi:hypothetical protein
MPDGPAILPCRRQGAENRAGVALIPQEKLQDLGLVVGAVVLLEQVTGTGNIHQWPPAWCYAPWQIEQQVGIYRHDAGGVLRPFNLAGQPVHGFRHAREH